MEHKKYKVQLAKSATNDVKKIKKYILDQFKYRQLASEFSKKIKRAISSLEVFPKGYSRSKITYKGKKI